MQTPSKPIILLAAFHTPGIHGLEHLFALGYTPDQIKLLTYAQESNQPLVSFAAAQGIEMAFHPIKSPEALAWIQQIAPDVLFSLYYRDIIPGRILDLFPLGAVNIHPALLPRYRGTFSAPWVIINGEQETGFSYHYMLPKVDAGHILLQERVTVLPQDTGYSLYYRLLTRAMMAFPRVVTQVIVQRDGGQPQQGESSYYPRQVPYGGYIDPSWEHDMIDRYIRALIFPPFKGALLKLKDGTDREILDITDYDALVTQGLV